MEDLQFLKKIKKNTKLKTYVNTWKTVIKNREQYSVLQSYHPFLEVLFPSHR